jgi:hypothetical protein
VCGVSQYVYFCTRASKPTLRSCSAWYLRKRVEEDMCGVGQYLYFCTSKSSKLSSKEDCFLVVSS